MGLKEKSNLRLDQQDWESIATLCEAAVLIDRKTKLLHR